MTAAVGTEWPATEYEVGREKIREYADALAIAAPIHRDHEAARAAGFRAVVAPPVFAAVYVARSLAGAMFDPRAGIFDPAVGLAGYRFVQRRQAFRWHEPVCAGDTITTTARLTEAEEREGAGYRTFESESVNQAGLLVLEGRYQGVVPAPEPRRRGAEQEAAPPAAGGGLTGHRPGERIPGFEITPDRYAAQRYAGASGDFTPFHLDAGFARAAGLPGIILHGLYTFGQLAHGLLEPFGGDPRVLRSLAARFRRPAFPERKLSVTGVVTAADGPRVEIACGVEQGGKEVVTEGRAVLELPAK
ncbi:MAG: MaoC family dehydratase N-terminal domain-containing protein [Solirubrobacterales bacterium]|nr:MaoC family dehydratase N-terminal domain-containing protein [Solirubrobacterales bacterium]